MHGQAVQQPTQASLPSFSPMDVAVGSIITSSYITTADNANPNGVGVATAATPSGSSSGYNDPALGFNNARYWAKDAQYSGVTQLIMSYSTLNTTTGVPGAASFICTGALINNGLSVLTAAHCVNNYAQTASNGQTTTFTLTGVQVRLGQQFGGNTTAEPGAGAPNTNQAFNYVQNVGASSVVIPPEYTGSVIDQRDIAVINLSTMAPSIYRSYELYTGSAIGMTYNIAGWGGRGNGNDGTFASGVAGGRLRQGLNIFDLSYADARFTPEFMTFMFGAAGAQDVYLSDFDNGVDANDALCRLSFGTLSGTPLWTGAARPCNTGVGIDEVSSAGGDSGGPSFIDGRIAAITSFGQTFGPGFFGDFKAGLNSSFGEINGMTRVDINAAWVSSVVALAAPEPATFVLVGGGLLLLAAAARRRQA